MRLSIQEPGKPAREIEAVDGLTIGRGPDNGCVLEDESASTNHARIVLVAGRLAIEDLGSRNGTRVEGGATLGQGESRVIEPGVQFLIGKSRLGAVGAAVELPTMRQVRAAPAEDLAATRPRTAAPSPAENATAHQPARSGDELATQRHAPGSNADQVTLRPAARVPPSPAKLEPAAQPAISPAANPVRSASAVPAQSKPPSVSIPIPATIPGAADIQAVGGLGLDGTMVVGSSATDPAAVQSRLAALKPRLVFVAHKQGRVEAITERDTKIGRRKAGAVAIGLDDEGVSGDHALLTFDGRAFFVEDKNSKNGTWVGESKLAPGSGRLEVRCDHKIRFGTVDALFVRDPEMGEKPSPADRYPRALKSLQNDASVPQDKVREAQQLLAQKKHPGEFLIAANAISVERWCEAIEAARIGDVVSGGSGSPTKPKSMTWILIAALVVAIGVIVWLATRSA